ncbi:MAG: Rne/Rng family ribonuclease [Rhodospirillales bacterium]|nr:Rne/Rng family ribonuclease [Rhodospirillales bacterium]
MAKNMLIDATHPEETRVVVVSGNRVEDFDVEVQSRKELKGNIYLAKVTRVEPSLQAAFVDYGGNRHGFLAFDEIHADYYQIPIADRQALMAEQTAAEAAEKAASESTERVAPSGGVETVGGDSGEEEEEVRRPRQLFRNYKIQEVIKRRQILLIQVVKEERGTKGAALTTYVSLAGRYCVLMPNTARGGGISRKIGNSPDRKRLKSILNELDIPAGMAVIVRTAGSTRSKAEIKRDYDYLLRLWTTIRETTLESIAPCLIHEEGNLIKRAIRDLYAKDIEEIIIAGDEGYRMARDFMKLLIPSHMKRVKLDKDEPVPLFHRYQIESQLDAIHNPQVQLRSGGYIVINPTEALVSIDVNSGRATRERNIEETALATNVEAADEIARQLRLRDLAGLIVIDFIDMEVSRNQTRVERQLKEALRNDRARIQVGPISPFGLLEMSRQRLRPSLLETSTEPCAHCGGTGIRRSINSSALHVLRAIEEEGLRHRGAKITVHVPPAIALYILNQKRTHLADIEHRYGIGTFLEADDSLIPPNYRITRIEGPATQPLPALPKPVAEQSEQAEAAPTATEPQTTPTPSAPEVAPRPLQPGEEEGGKRRRRRRGRRRGRDGQHELQPGGQQPGGQPHVVQPGSQPYVRPEGHSPDTAGPAPEGVSEPAPFAPNEPQAGAGGPPQPRQPHHGPGGPTDAEHRGRRRRRGRRGGKRRGHRHHEGVDPMATPANSMATPANPYGQAAGDIPPAGVVASAEPVVQPNPSSAPQPVVFESEPRQYRKEPAFERQQEPTFAREMPTPSDEPRERHYAAPERVTPPEPPAPVAHRPAETVAAEPERPEPDRAAASKTVIIDVDAAKAPDDGSQPKRGWWQRFNR